MKKSILVLWIITIIFSIWFLFFREIKESVIYVVFFLIYISSFFFVVSHRNKERLEHFLFIAENLRKYFFPAFALFSAWLLLILLNTTIELPNMIIIWYIMLFVFINLIILIPTITLLDKNINSLFARIYFVTSIYLFGFGSSVLSGAIGGSIMGKNWNWLIIDPLLYWLLSYLEIIISLFLIFYLFKINVTKSKS